MDLQDGGQVMGKREHPNKFAAVRYVEDGHSAKEAAEVAGVDRSTIGRWWAELHPGLPMRSPAPKARFLKLIGHCVRKVRFDVYECPYCYGVIYQPQVSAPKPWHCPWCGRDVK